MARPTKQGIDYFSLDCNNDSKLELYIAEAGIESYGILISLWQMIYRDCGYYVSFNDDLILLLRKHTLSSTETIEKAIIKAVNRGLFSEKLFKEYKILTSTGIQKRYFDAAKRKKTVTVDYRYKLVQVSDYINVDNVDINLINNRNNATKEKEKEKEKEKGKGKENPKTSFKTYLKEKIIQHNFIEIKDKIFEFYQYRMSMSAPSRYKTEKGINGLFRDLNGCRKAGLIVGDCLEEAMEREWKTPNPGYFNNKSGFKSRSDSNKQACVDFINEMGEEI